MKIVCNYNDPSIVPEGLPNNFDYGLILGKEYLVMGIVLYNDALHMYYLIDEGGKPSWYPSWLFGMVDNSLPNNWFFKQNPNKTNEYTFDNHIYCIFGFKELCDDENFYFQLLLREDESMLIYFKRKMELEKYYEDLKYLK